MKCIVRFQYTTNITPATKPHFYAGNGTASPLTAGGFSVGGPVVSCPPLRQHTIEVQHQVSSIQDFIPTLSNSSPQIAKEAVAVGVFSTEAPLMVSAHPDY